jgi:hypothetical protein
VTQPIARKKKLIHWDVQGTLLIRTAFYWALCILVTGLVMLAWTIYKGPNGAFISHFRFGVLWQHYGFALIASLFTLPLILIDTLHISHRFIGPNSRIRKSMRALADGETVDLIRFRKNDFLHEMADEFNDVAIYVEKLKRQVAELSEGRAPAADNRREPVAAK